MDSERVPESSDDVDGERNSAEINGESSHAKVTTTPKISEPGPLGDANPDSRGRHVARAKEKGNSRYSSASRRSWKYPNGPPVPQPNQEPLTLEQCLKITERDLFKRHEYHKTSIAQKDVYIQYLKFLIETSGRLLYPPGPFPRPPALCLTSFGSDFSQFLTDVRYDGNDNIRWIPRRVATPKVDAGRNEENEPPEGLSGTRDETERSDQGRQLPDGNDVTDEQRKDLITQYRESHPIQNIQPQDNGDPSQLELLPETARVSLAIPTEDLVTSASEIRGPVSAEIPQRSLVLESGCNGETSRPRSPEPKLRGEFSVPQRSRSRGLSGSVLPIPYQSDQERLWLKYHEMQLHFDAEIDEMDSRIETLKKHLVRVGGSVDANGVARAGSRTNSEGRYEKLGGDGASKTEITEIRCVWLQGVRQSIGKLKEMAPRARRTPRLENSKTGHPARVVALPTAADPTKPDASVDMPDLHKTSNEALTAERASRGCTLNELPYEILSAILGCLRVDSQAALSLTCRLWHQILTPMIWKNVYIDEQRERTAGQRRAYRELKRVTPSNGEGEASNNEKEDGNQNPIVKTFWPIGSLTVQRSITNDNEAGGVRIQEPADKADGVDRNDDEDWWKRSSSKPTRNVSPEYMVPMTTTDEAISYNESLALMPITVGILRALW
ncbi:hypothetical protein GP486_003400 [Trichoglossum hirsutum]|uniref:F-box domain-containing protein n=1 Tax=Trichoglossum hirsutum TaxID=265104 RepID=A0A9P8LCN7_9PEZI|nr:hypothetical protein GP486_003400 [Trichoglossum hirsutum]